MSHRNTSIAMAGLGCLLLQDPLSATHDQSMASEHGKSAGYVGRSGNTGIMFLAEAALGKEHSILRDDSRLKFPPKGYHSIVARGVTEPDPKLDTTIKLEGKTVVVPQGAPIKQKDYGKSNFSQSEYLVYQESQVRLRYLLKLKM